MEWEYAEMLGNPADGGKVVRFIWPDGEHDFRDDITDLEALNEAGADGWEVAGSSVDTGDGSESPATRYVLRRNIGR